MRRSILVTILITVVFGWSAGADGGVGDHRRLPASMDEILNEVDWTNRPPQFVLGYLAGKAGVNLVMSKTVTGNVMMTLRKVSIKDAFDIVVFNNLLAYMMKGNILYVMSGVEYEEMYGEKFNDIREVKVFRLKYAVPEKAYQVADILKSTVGSLTVDEESGTIMIIDTPEKIQEMQKALEVLESRSDVKVFTLNYAQAEDVEKALKGELDDLNVGSIKADEKNNQVIVRTLSDRMKHIEELIAALDKKTKQVMIDTKIVQISLRDDFEAEIRWEGVFTALTKNGLEFLGSHPLAPMSRLNESNISQFATVDAATTPDALSPVIPGEQTYFGVYNTDHDGEQIEGMFRLLRTLGEVKILSNPKLAVVNNTEASIHVGRNQSYITTTSTTGGQTSTLAENLESVKIGIQLAVTPTINDEGYITMEIKPEVSSVVDTLITPSNNRIPIVDTSTAETTVMAKDGSTILIGGLRREEEVLVNKRVPFFGSIPIIGHLFRSRVSSKLRSEVLVMITPRLMDGDVLTIEEDISIEAGLKPYIKYTAPEINPDPAAVPAWVSGVTDRRETEK